MHPQRDLVVGTPKPIADHLQDLFESRACDSFVVSPAIYGGMIEQFCRMVVPELLRRGIFRKETGAARCGRTSSLPVVRSHNRGEL